MQEAQISFFDDERDAVTDGRTLVRKDHTDE